MKNEIIILGVLILTNPIIAMSTTSLNTGYDYTNFGSDHGSKNIFFADLKSKLDKGAVVLGMAQGNRDYGHGDNYDGTRARATVWYNWNSVLSTRSSISFGTNSPVFVRREILNDFNLNLVKNTVLTVGGRHAEYYGGTEVNSWSAGVSLYKGPFITTYRYTKYDTVGISKNEGHLVTVRLKDPTGKGNTQILASTGTGAYTYDWTPETRDGKLHNLSIKRVQPVNQNVSLAFVFGKQWFDTPTQNYTALNGQVVMELSW